MLRHLAVLLLSLLPTCIAHSQFLPIAQWQDADQFWAKTKVLVSLAGAHGSTTFTDESPSARTVTTVGNSVVDSGVTHFGANTGLFDGTGDYLTLPNHADLSVANETDKTIEAWVYITATGKTHTIANKRDATGAEEFSFYISPGNIVGISTFNSGVANSGVLSTTALSLNTWYHVAAVRTGGLTWKLYVNGISEGGSDDETSQPSSNTGVMHIGRDGYNTTRDFQGRISDFRYTNAARYVTNFTPPNRAYLRR